MDCDCVALAAHMRAQSPSAPASARTPAERLREVWSEERGWPWCWCRALGVAAAALSALPRAIRASSTALRRSGRRETQEERSQQQSVTAAGAAAVRRSSPSSPAPRSPLQQLESMATALESRCPICLDTWDNVGYVMPCLHQFCFRCIQQWWRASPSAPSARGGSAPSCTRCGQTTNLRRSSSQRRQKRLSSPSRLGELVAAQPPPTPVTVLQHHHQLQGRLLWEASSLKFGPPFCGTTQLSSVPCCPGCARS
eukprot:XP_027303916.1 uncharacterized protein LOC113841459 [Anas platyrhynchos]